MSASFAEMPSASWKKLDNWKKPNLRPSFTELRAAKPSFEFVEKPAVFVTLDDVVLFDMRDWIHNRVAKHGDENCRQYEMYGRFHVRQFEVDYVGASFRFLDIQDAVLFKMFWA
jgi:hypothetical protein